VRRDSCQQPALKVATRAYGWITKSPLLSLGLCLAFAIGLASFAKIDIDTRLEIWFLEGDESVDTYNEYVDRFESDEFIAVALLAEDVFTDSVLVQVREIGSELAELDGATEVISLATTERVMSDGVSLSVIPLFEEIPDSDEELEALRALVHNDRLLREMVSDDDTSTVILVQHVPFEDLRDKAAFAIAARGIAHDAVGPDGFRAAGNAFVEEALQTYTLRDMKLLAPLTGLAILLLTFVLFRNPWCTIVPTTIVGLTLMSTVGLAGALGVKLNMITTIVMPLAIAVGVADSVHLISGYRERLGWGLDREEALRNAWLELYYPCVVTTLTTATGLASLLVANLTPIRQFGWMGAATVLFALLYTLVLVPAFFSLVKAPTPTVEEEGSLMARTLERVARFSWGHNRVVLAIVAVLIVVSAVGATQIQVGADFSAYFRPDDPVFQDSRFIDANLGGTGSIDLMIQADDIRAPEVLAAVEEFDALILENPAILSSDSPARLVRTLHERFFGDPEHYVLPGTLAGAAQLLAQTEGTDVHHRLMVVDYSAARVRGRVRASDYRDLILNIERIESETAAIFDGVADAEITGIGKLVTKLDSYIVSSQVRSFLLAFATVALLLGLFFRSFKIGIWAMVPNALPIVMVLGFMGWFGVLLDVATVMVASIMLGLVVDDTTHYLARYRLEWRSMTPEEREDPEARAGAAIRTGVGTGRAITTTSIILACGFWVSLFGSFQPNINFGLMGGAATVIAMVCDLVALPAVIRLWPLRVDEE
jgi:hypothetical protein